MSQLTSVGRFIKAVLLFLVAGLPLLGFAQQPKLMLPTGHSGDVNSVEFSPDGKLVVTAGEDLIAKIWDAQNGFLLGNLKGHTGGINMAEFSPDGRYIATASHDYTARIWDVKTMMPIRIFKGHKDDVNTARFSPDGRTLLTSSLDGSARLWNIETGVLIREFKHPNTSIFSARFSKSGQLAVVAAGDKTATIWDTGTGAMIAKLTGNSTIIKDAEFSPDEQTLVTVSGDKPTIWNARTGAIIAKLKDPNAITYVTISSSLNSAHFSRDGQLLVTASEDGTARVWNLKTMEVLHVLSGHRLGVAAANFSVDGRLVVTASKDNTAKVWDARKGVLLTDLKGYKDPIHAAVFSPDGNLVATASYNGAARIWNPVSGVLVADLRGHLRNVNTLRFSNNNRQILAGFDDGTAKIFDLNTGKAQGVFKASLVGIAGAHFSPDGAAIIVTAGTRSKIWLLESGMQAADLPGGGTNKDAFFSPDSRLAVTLPVDGNVKLWDAKTGSLRAELKSASANNAEFAPDSRILAVASDFKITLWDTGTGQLRLEVPYIKAGIISVHFSANGRKMTAAERDYTGRVWDTSTGKLLLTLPGNISKTTSIKFSPDDRTLLTTGKDNITRIWNADKGTLLFSLKGHTQSVISSQFSSDGSKILTVSADETAKVWNARTGTLLYSLQGSESPFASGVFSPDGKQIVTVSLDNRIKVWDAKTGRSLYTLLATDNEDYLAIDPFGRYDGTDAARKLLYFTCGLEAVSLDQVKDRLWVPGLAERLMRGDVINAPKLSDLDICGLTPDIGIKGQDGFREFKITPRKGGLGQTVLIVNDIEVRRYAASDLIKTDNGYLLRIAETELQPFFVNGKTNKISVKSYTLKNDIASRGIEAEISDERNAIAPNLYAVMVGVSDYKGEELDLKYASKDAEDFSGVIGNSARKLLNTNGIEHVFIYNLNTGPHHDQLPEKLAIQNIFAEIGKKATANDIILVFFAGHGVLDSKTKQFYFLTADASRSSAVEAPFDVGISTAELSEWIKPGNIKAQKRILIFDACNSGQAVNEFVKIGAEGQQYLAARGDDNAWRIKAVEKLNERSGMFILAASASNQSAYEMGRYAQGVLTYAMLKSIKEQPDILEDTKYLNVGKWFSATEKIVSDIAKLSGNIQQPQIVAAGNFNIGVVDQGLIANIKLPTEKTLFSTSNFQNIDERIADDDLGISKRINQTLASAAVDGKDLQIAFVPETSSPDAYWLSGRYEVSSGKLTIKVNIRNKAGIAEKFEITGSLNDIESLARDLVIKANKLVSGLKK